MDRQQAIAAGAKTYTGRACPHGHSGLRRVRNGECVDCRKIYASNPELLSRKNAKQRATNLDTKARAMALFGSKCSCCGEDNLAFLTVDHKDGKGADHRRSIWGINSQGTGHRFYRWLLGQTRRFVLARFQCLCFNCNLATHILGECPHAAQAKA